MMAGWKDGWLGWWRGAERNGYLNKRFVNELTNEYEWMLYWAVVLGPWPFPSTRLSSTFFLRMRCTQLQDWGQGREITKGKGKMMLSDVGWKRLPKNDRRMRTDEDRWG